MGCLKLHIEENYSALKVVHRAENPVQKQEQAFFFSPEKTDAGEYCYGFNGMEKDDEVAGDGNSYTTPFRQYDPRLGRWMSLDPLMAKYPHQSPYAAFNNNPIYFADPTGLEGDPPKKDEKVPTGLESGRGTEENPEELGEAGVIGKAPGWLKKKIANIKLKLAERKEAKGLKGGYTQADIDYIENTKVNNPLAYRSILRLEQQGIHHHWAEGGISGEGFARGWEAGGQDPDSYINMYGKVLLIANAPVLIAEVIAVGGGMLVESTTTLFIPASSEISLMAFEAQVAVHGYSTYAIGSTIGATGSAYFFLGSRLFGKRFYRLGANPSMTTLDRGHFYARTLMSQPSFRFNTFGKVKNYNTIYFNYPGIVGDKAGYFSYGINPWTRTVFHASPGKFN